MHVARKLAAPGHIELQPEFWTRSFGQEESEEVAMAPFRRGKIYYADFSVNGQRFRPSLCTTDWREAQAKEKVLIAEATQGKLSPQSQQFARRAFGEAADRFLLGRQLDLSDASRKKERQLL